MFKKWLECFLCKENREEKGTDYVVELCSDCYVKPIFEKADKEDWKKDFESWADELREKENSLKFWEKKVNFRKNILEFIEVLGRLVIPLIFTYVALHGHRWGVDCWVCKYRGILSCSLVLFAFWAWREEIWEWD